MMEADTDKVSFEFVFQIQAAEAADPDGLLPFSITVLVMGLAGSGKSATINTMLGREARFLRVLLCLTHCKPLQHTGVVTTMMTAS